MLAVRAQTTEGASGLPAQKKHSLDMRIAQFAFVGALLFFALMARTDTGVGQFFRNFSNFIMGR